jgi:acyl-CoA thioester hydrolase
VAGHVNNVQYLTFTELARIHYCDEVLGRGIDWSKQGIILARQEIDYKKPVYIRDSLKVLTRCVSVGNKSFVLEYKITNQNDEVVALSASVLVSFDYSSKQTTQLPEEWKKKLMDFDKLK